MKVKNKFNGIVNLVLILLLTGALVYAGDESRIGTAAGVQVLIPVGARELAMGGADIVFTNGVNAIYYNPAGLSNFEKSTAATFSHISIFNDIGVNYLAIATNMGSLGHLGFSIKALDIGDIPVTTVEDMNGTSGETFSPTFATVGLTYANKLTNAIQVGLTAKMIYESIPRASASALAFDIGIQYQNLAGIEGVSFGVVAKNIGTSMEYGGTGLLDRYTTTDNKQRYLSKGVEPNQLPASIEFGVAYNYKIVEKNDLIVVGNFQSNNVQNDETKFGLEYSYDNFVALRGGYLLMSNTDAKDQLYRFTLGAGLNYNLGGATVSIDYAFRDSQYFDANNMFSLKVVF